MLMRIIGLPIYLIIFASVCFAQFAPKQCDAPIEYRNTSQEASNISVRVVEGYTAFTLGKNEVGAVTGVCYGLFTEEHLRLVRTAVSDNNGHFTFGSIPNGRYRLVSQTKGFHDINTPLRVDRWPRGGFFKRKRLAVHLRFLRDKRTSFVTTQTSKNFIRLQE
jgi:hypothetical protein